MQAAGIVGHSACDLLTLIVHKKKTPPFATLAVYGIKVEMVMSVEGRERERERDN